MEVIHTILVIYAALYLEFTVILTGGQMREIVTNRGKNVILYCDFQEPITLLNYQWYFTQNGGEKRHLINETRYTLSYKQIQGWVRIQISLTNVTFDDTGIYTCEAMTTTGADRKEILLTVIDLPVVIVQQTQFFSTAGEDIVLNCTIDGSGVPIQYVRWYRRYSFSLIPLTNEMKYEWSRLGPDASIRIKHAFENDTGTYVCEGITTVGSSKGKDIKLRVWSKPSLIIPVFEYKAINGTTVVLKVRIDDKMQTSLSVQWEKYKEDNKQWLPLENNSRHLWTYAEPSLQLATVLVEDDGKYRIICKTACHEVTSSNITLTIDVPVKIKELETRPVFIREGDTVKIRCLVDGRPEPKVTWKLADGTTIVASSLKNVQENILILESVTNLKEGDYTCIAENNFSSDESLISLTVSDLPLFNPPNEELTGSPLEKYVVPGVSVFICVALIALIVVIILIRRKRQKGRTDKPNLGIRSTNEQEHPSPSENIQSGNNHSKFYVHLSGDMTYAQVIRKSSNIIDENKSIRDTNIPQPNIHIDETKSTRDASIPQSDTHIDGNESIRDTDASQVYMNINNAYAAVQQRSSTINSNSCINEETESENTQVKKTEELNYVELEFSANAQDENSSHGIRGFPSDTTYTEVLVFTR